MEHRVVRHGSRETAYRMAHTAGSGDGIVFVHGAGLDGRVWGPLIERIDDHPVAIVDLSGHGESADIDAQAGGETSTAYTADLEAVLEAVDARYLIGHDLGGAVVLETLASEQVIDGAVVIGVGPRIPVQTDMRDLAANDLAELIAVLHEPGRLFADPTHDDAALTRSMLRETGQSVVRRDYETCHRLDLTGQLASTEIPVRVLVGAYDRLTPPESNRKLADALPHGSLSLVADCAHVPMLERPQAVREVVRGAIADGGEPA